MKIKTVRCLHVQGILDEPIGTCETPKKQPYDDWRDDGNRNIRFSFIEITTDDGITGLSRSCGLEPARKACRMFAKSLVGRDPHDIDEIWDELFEINRRENAWHGHLFIVDMALWDILGKAAGKPVCELLGENPRSELPVYASMPDCSTDSDKLRERALRLQQEGYPVQKWFLTNVDQPWFGDKFKTPEEGMADDIRIVRELRETLGPDAGIMLDCYGGWTEEQACEMIEAIEQYKPYWLEAPVDPRDLETTVRIRERTSIPIAAGSWVHDTETLKRVLDSGAYDVWQPDSGSLGGITGMMRAVDLCREYDITVVPHAGDVATMHFLAAQDGKLCPFFEYLVLWLKIGQWFYKDRYLPENGALKVPQAPGIGIELDSDRILEQTHYDG